jgi:hypothetical protein
MRQRSIWAHPQRCLPRFESATKGDKPKTVRPTWCSPAALGFRCPNWAFGAASPSGAQFQVSGSEERVGVSSNPAQPVLAISKLHQYPNANKRPEGGEWIVTHTRPVGLNSGQYRMCRSEFYEIMKSFAASSLRRRVTKEAKWVQSLSASA